MVADAAWCRVTSEGNASCQIPFSHSALDNRSGVGPITRASCLQSFHARYWEPGTQAAGAVQGLGFRD